MNRNTVPFDERPPTVASGFRVGTPAMTMRGLDEDDFREIGRIMCEALPTTRTSSALAARSATLVASADRSIPGLSAFPDFGG